MQGDHVTCGRERLAKFKPAKLFIRTATPATNDTACICPAQMAGRYERQRLANIAKNQAKLAELGLLDTTLLPRKPSPVAKKRKRTRQPAAPQRRSRCWCWQRTVKNVPAAGDRSV
jgi:hypothetical protein